MTSGNRSTCQLRLHLPRHLTHVRTAREFGPQYVHHLAHVGRAFGACLGNRRRYRIRNFSLGQRLRHVRLQHAEFVFFLVGEVLPPGAAYAGAATASSLLIVFYCVSILKSTARAGLVAGLLAGEHSILYVVLRLEDYALLAGTAALLAALGAVMYFTRNVDWFAQDAERAA